MLIGKYGNGDIELNDTTKVISIGGNHLPVGERGEKALIGLLTKTDADVTFLGDAYLKVLINKHYPGTLKE